MPLDISQFLVPLLSVCGSLGVFLTAIACDLRAHARHRATALTENELDERFAIALVAETLIRELDLRTECRDQVLAEVRRERRLVVAWLQSQAAAGAIAG
jgi:hypothetical protein